MIQYYISCFGKFVYGVLLEYCLYTDMEAGYFGDHLTFQTNHFRIYLVTETKLKDQSVKYGDINGGGVSI